MNPLISIIVPVYNVEKYIERCINSLLNQTLKQIEIILIDDGSTDNSPKICDKYSCEYENIKIIHKKNNRASAARNDGIKIASGKYIALVDSDDWIELSMLEEMYNKSEEFQTDITMCDLKKVGVEYEYTVNQSIRQGYYDRSMIESELFPCLIMFEDIEFPPTISNCTCLFRREFLIENKLFYDEDIHYCEDSIFGSKAMYNANGFYYMKNRYFYNYFYNPNSTTSICNMKKWDSYLLINKRLREYFKDSKFDFSRQIKINMLYFTLNYLKEIGKSNLEFEDKRKECKKIFCEGCVNDIFKDFKIPSVNYKLRIILLLIKYKMDFIYSKLFYY